MRIPSKLEIKYNPAYVFHLVLLGIPYPGWYSLLPAEWIGVT